MSNVAPPAPVRMWPVLLVNAAAAAWLDFTRLHELHSSDSFIFSLASLYEWRPFFWEQDRVGLLVPLLLSWCQHPLANLLLQTGVMTFVGLTLPLAFARLVSSSPAVPAAVTLLNAAFVALAPPRFHDNLFIVCNYPAALVLTFVAVRLLDQPTRRTVRLIAAAALIGVAHWVYLGVSVFLLPLLVVRVWMAPGVFGWRRWVRPAIDRTVVVYFLSAIVSVGLIALLMRHVREVEPYTLPTNPDTLPVEDWPWTAGSLIGQVFIDPLTWAYAAGLLLPAGIGVWIAWKRNRPAVRRGLWFGAIVLAASICEFGLLATREWVVTNSYHPRYLIAITTGLAVAVALVGLVPVFELLNPRWRRWALPLAAVLLLLAASARYGWPGPNVPGRVFEARLGDVAREVEAADPDAVGADYWLSWPIVHYVNQRRYERGDRRVLSALALRCGVWEGRWKRDHPDGLRVFIPGPPGPHEPDWNHMALEPFIEWRYGERATLTPELTADGARVVRFRFR